MFSEDHVSCVFQELHLRLLDECVHDWPADRRPDGAHPEGDARDEGSRVRQHSRDSKLLGNIFETTAIL